MMLLHGYGYDDELTSFPSCEFQYLPVSLTYFPPYENHL
jgi:hypothetical protein